MGTTGAGGSAFFDTGVFFAATGSLATLGAGISLPALVSLRFEREVDRAGGSGALGLLLEAFLGGAALAATLACLAFSLAGICVKILLF